MEGHHAPIILREMKKYISLNMYDSAEQLGNFYLSSVLHKPNENESKSQNARESIHLAVAEIYELIADVAYQRKEIRRALNYYRLALQQRKLITNNALTSSNSNNNVRPQVNIVMSEVDAKLRYKECKCQAELKETAAALRDLEAIPQKYRDLAILTLMGNLYNESNLKRHAISSFKEALMLSPLSTEVIQQLVNFGCDLNEIVEVVNESLKVNPDFAPIITKDKWLQVFISSLIQKKSYDTEKSYSNLLTLNGFFPKNPMIMSLIALNAMDAEQNENSIASFKKIRQMDSTIIDNMDIYAKLLFQKKEELELNRLATEVIENNPTRPQGYLIASWYCLLKADPENALSFVEKALMLNPKYSETYKVKGRHLYHQKNFESSLIAFTQANSMNKDLGSFVGIIESNIALGKYKDAANCAREMVLLYQKSAEVFYVMGTVLGRSPQGANESIRAYGKALKIQPRMKKAAVAMSMTLLELNRPEEALTCLNGVLSKVSDPKLRLLLAKTYSALGKYHDALEQLQICISLQPNKTDPEATKEIEKIEEILKGENSGNFQEEDEELIDEDDKNQSGTPIQDSQFISDAGNESSLINEHIAHGNNLFSRQMEMSGELFDEDD